MAIYAGAGSSKNNDSAQAGYEAYKSALSKIGANPPNIIILFASSNFDQKGLIHGIRQAGGTVDIVGCSTSGEIINGASGSKSAAIMVISSDTVRFYSGLGRGIEYSAREAGFNAAKEIKEVAGGTLKSALIFPDVLSGNVSEMLKGFLGVLGYDFPLVGGAAGDDFLFVKTYQYRNDEVVSDAVSAIGIAGDFSMGLGVRHGWVPIGIPMTITKSRGSMLYELNGAPAIRLYEEYFGMSAEDLSKDILAKVAATYPLGFKTQFLDEYLIRWPLIVDEKGVIKCSAEIPQGAEARLMIGSKEKALKSAEDAALSLMRDFEEKHKEPKFVLMFSSAARAKLFSRDADSEIKKVVNIIGKDVPFLGFYTYGEIAPAKSFSKKNKNNFSNFYNETLTLFGVGE